ncbi:gliding motility-associated C-terminal domain-containing protein [Tenacibaculum ovolyticum]|uniref:gliding motility-associated C-terminal domain-containing protein n=1 Tax=Tenacibaculum ovolyticum TaxID=104270 RepID=UPI0007EDA8CF|nr:gliding motility-associated C-terminal domain-containing protein [Tenacibaculum ovolyticum]
MVKKILFILLVILHFSTSYATNKIYTINNLDKHQNSLTEVTICEGENLALTAHFYLGANYQWFTPDQKIISTIDLVRTKVSTEMAGIYILIINNNGCDDKAEIDVIIIPKPNAGSDGYLEIIKGLTPTQEELFSALGGTPDKDGIWTKNKNNIYTYTVSSKNNCKSNSKATIKIIENIEITNGFSPNNDQINDTWVITSNLLKNYPENNLLVFNRHGNKVYEASPYNNDWDGIANSNLIINRNTKLPPGPYYYILKLNNPSNNFLKGWVYINY